MMVFQQIYTLAEILHEFWALCLYVLQYFKSMLTTLQFLHFQSSLIIRTTTETWGRYVVPSHTPVEAPENARGAKGIYPRENGLAYPRGGRGVRTPVAVSGVEGVRTPGMERGTTPAYPRDIRGTGVQ